MLVRPPVALAVALLALGACPRATERERPADAGPAASNAKDVLCVEQTDGCIFCEARETDPGAFDPDESRPIVCDPKDDEECVEFCTPLAAECALPWTKGARCLLPSEEAFRRATFARDAAGSPELVFTGRVVDAAGKRLEGARVQVWHAAQTALTPLLRETAGKDGVFKLPLRSGPWTYAIRISHPGKTTELVEKLPLDKPDPKAVAPAPRTFRLAEEVTLKGKVVDATTGAPLADAVVEAVRAAEDLLAVGETRSTADGSFTLSGLEARRYVVRASKFGFRPDVRKPNQTVAAPGTRLVVKLARTGVIRGTVLDDEGDPVSNAVVAALLSGQPSAATPTIYWTTDSDGHFAQDRLPPGSWFVWARRREALHYPPAKVELVEGQEDVELTLALAHRGARVSGVVRPHGSGRLPEWPLRVVLQSRSPLAFPRPLVGDVGPQGRFTVGGLLPGRYEIAIRSDVKPVAVVAGPRSVDVPIEPGSAVPIDAPIVVRVGADE